MVLDILKKIKDHLVAKRIHKTRLVTKDGHCNIEFDNMNCSNRFAFLVDFWTTFVELRWRFVLFYFSAISSLSWGVFGLLWFWVAHSNGDLSWQTTPGDHIACVSNIAGLTDAFLYSLETQTTIGYGGRAITAFCPGAIALLMTQSLIGIIINCFLCGAIIAKISLPKKRAKTIVFSEKAVICPKKDNLCLIIRVANLRKTLMIASQVYGKLLRTTVTPSGETAILDQVNIGFMVETMKDNLFFMCPLTLYHVIEEASPFFDMAVDMLQEQEFELVVFLDGTAESTSSACQVRTSFLPQEIMWGYNFLPIISRSKEGRYKVDFSNFSKVIPVATEHCAHCFYKVPGDHLHSIHGFDNMGLEVVDIEPSI
ncbi:hypothetical protein DPEC_G00115910 [Dallia pectoralis]|uniref:Uncharacterized protein n=1 Tax=Dallia pectoralis TaxID=75939 RepID=A0ACC2GUY9_DALPE|nr:hypothetical protein DPEC_G00115910 [Dallia pectoralis]